MSQCQRCRKYVHTTCDAEADRTIVQRKKDINPDYEYLCPPCKVASPSRPSFGVEFEGATSADVKGNLAIGQEQSLQQQNLPVISEDAESSSVAFGDDSNGPVGAQQDATKNGVPARTGHRTFSSHHHHHSAGKLARKRLSGLTSSGGGPGGRPKGSGKTSAFAAAGISATGVATYNRKTNKMTEFGRKRGPKPKLRGVFGAPGVGLQRPGGGASADGAVGNGTTTTTTSGSEGEPCLENKLILCSSSDSFVVEQDACAMCGSFGLDQEGRLISCAQCGQCYHPFCANVKVTKVILQKGWRCLDW